MKQLRVVPFKRTSKPSIRDGLTMTVHGQRLQVRRWYGWQTIDEELMPQFVGVHKQAIGGKYDDGIPFMSKFYSIGVFGPDGIIKPHEYAFQRIDV